MGLHDFRVTFNVRFETGFGEISFAVALTVLIGKKPIVDPNRGVNRDPTSDDLLISVQPLRFYCPIFKYSKLYNYNNMRSTERAQKVPYCLYLKKIINFVAVYKADSIGSKCDFLMFKRYRMKVSLTGEGLVLCTEQ